MERKCGTQNSTQCKLSSWIGWNLCLVKNFGCMVYISYMYICMHQLTHHQQWLQTAAWGRESWTRRWTRPAGSCRVPRGTSNHWTDAGSSWVCSAPGRDGRPPVHHPPLEQQHPPGSWTWHSYSHRQLCVMWLSHDCHMTITWMLPHAYTVVRCFLHIKYM